MAPRATSKKKAAPAKKAVRTKKAASKAASTSGALMLPTLHESTTSGGLKVLAAERGPLPMVAARLVIRAGSAADPSDKHGLADFTARLLRRGTAKMSADELDEAIEFVGASISVGSSEDVLSLFVTTPAEHFPAMLSVLGQLVREPSFPEREVELARERALAGFSNDLDDPSVIADRAFTRALWGNHPYGHDVGGSAAHVKTFTREDLVRFHRERMGPRVSLLTVVGAVNPQQVAEEAEKAFAGWEGGPEAPVELPPADTVATGHVLLVDKPDQTQTQVRIGGPGFRVGHPDYFPSTTMNNALGGGFTSRLVNEVRVERGLTYGIHSYFDMMNAGGVFGISTFTQTDKTREIIDVSLAEVAKVRRSGISPAELKKAQRYLAGLYPLRTETNESVASVISDIRVHGLGDDWVEKFRERLLAVKTKQTVEVAAKYLYAKPPLIVLLGRAEAVKPLLKGLGSVTVVPASDYE
ncbi:pitrilysin family protein [Vitiosangium sp. GDMCC 1.1324]|uniref:M16 family metallopeptidase n=1 Tax=Vitiosangium sp. (strain GDMCC 1.1324) TaxID=2138576 RepID=UPI000D364791|nr:pitrilysin family protein [Vitiosangium sp. GDMCC 1.1324]PTL80969.1 peptidase M16 [Vitiosangium sp. GDMCC 1.1324]